MKNKKSNIKDVAKKAGISATTVSAYLNKSAPVNVKTAKRIKEAIEELNYKPNLIARSLKQKRSKTLGFVFPDIENPFFIRLIKKAEEIAYNRGYNVTLCISENNAEKEKKYLEMLKGKLVDGYIVIPTSSIRSEEYSLLLDGENVVFIDRYSHIKNEVCVKLDNVLGSKLAIKYLISLGHKRIGIVNIPLEITPGIERFEGYKITLKENKIKFDPDLVKFADYSIKGSYQKTKELLALDEKPTAIFSTGIMTSVGALKYLRESNINIPDEISFISFDDLYDYSELLRFKPTIIKQPVEKIAESAIGILLKKIANKKIKNRNIIIEPEILIESSCMEVNESTPITANKIQ